MTEQRRNNNIQPHGEGKYRIFSQVNNMRTSKVVEGSRRAATTELEHLKVTMRAKNYVDPKTSPMLRAAFDEYLVTLMDRVNVGDGDAHRRLGKAHYDNYERNFRQFCEVKIGGVFVGDMKCELITEELVDEIVKALKVGRTWNTVDKLVTNVNAAFKYFVRKKYNSINPTEGVEIYTGNEKRKHRRLTKEEVDKIFRHAPQPFKLPLYFCANTGMRFGEMIALTWNDINFDRAEVRIDKALKKAGKGERRVLGDPKTDAGVRRIDLKQNLLKQLLKWRETQPKQQRRLNLVFPKADGSYYQDSDDWREKGVKNACIAAGIKKATFKDLRNFYASVLIYSQMFSDSNAAEFIGHSDISTTKRYYARWFEDRNRDKKIKSKVEEAFAEETEYDF